MQREMLFQVEQHGEAPSNRWRVRRGQQWVVMGPNGSGKSLLAAVLADEARVRTWRVTWSTAELAERVAWVGFAHQCACVAASWMQARWHTSLADDETRVDAFLAYDSVYEINPFEVCARETAERRAFEKRRKALLRDLALRPLCTKALTQLSNGEMRHVLLGRALLKEPSILVLDDPFAGLDPAMLKTIVAVLARMVHEGLTLILMVRHRDEIPLFCTHHLLLENSRFRAQKKLCSAGDGAPDKVVVRVQTAKRATEQPMVVEMRNVSVRYGRKNVLNHLSWCVRSGERWLITGPNGCGKTTLLSLITGDNPAGYANVVRIFGQSRQEGQSVWQIRRRIGHVSPEMQAYADETMTVLDCALSALYSESGTLLTPRAPHRQQARSWLTCFGLADALRKPMSELSAGHQRLVFLARALVAHPDLLILDELCMNLDEAARQNVLHTVEALARQRPELTMLCVAHRADDVPSGFTHHLALGNMSATRSRTR